MNLLDKIKLIIEARSFYVKKIFIPHIGIIGMKFVKLSDCDTIKKYIEDEGHGVKVKRILRHHCDEQRFGYIVWYI